MNNCKKSLLCVAMLLVTSAAFAGCDYSKNINVSISDNLGTEQSVETAYLQFDKGASLVFSVSPYNKSQTQTIKLPVCDEYSYTINGETTFLKSSKKWKGAYRKEYGQGTIKIQDNDKLALFAVFDPSDKVMSASLAKDSAGN